MEMNWEPFHQYERLLESNPGGGGMSRESAAVQNVIFAQQSTADIGGHICEIGSFRGFGAALFAQHLNENERLILVDRFSTMHDALPAIRAVAPDKVDRIDFHEADSRIIASRNLLPHAYATCRIIHVDGEHSYEAVISDIELASSLMIPAGLIIVDDVFSCATPQLTQGLFEYLMRYTHKVRMVLCGFNKAYLCAPEFLHYYRSAVLKLPDLLSDVGIMTRVCAAGRAGELTYLGIVTRDLNDPNGGQFKYQAIGKYTNDVKELNLAS